MSTGRPTQPPFAPTGPNRWLARDFADLLETLPRRPTCLEDIERWPAESDFDVLIIGSGYGGALAAAELAGHRRQDDDPHLPVALRVAVLERGREYLPGQFPDQLSKVPTALRNPGRQSGEGLYEIRANADLTVVSANGLGGGSLINAGVLEAPEATVFDGAWPKALQGGDALQYWLDQAHERIGGGPRAQPNTIADHEDASQRTPLKLAALDRLAGPGKQARRAAITVQVNPQQRMPGGVELDSCIGCGDCASGCNYNAKRSLDTGPLVEARRQGADIFCGAEVIRVERFPKRKTGWVVWVNYTDRRLGTREGGPTPLFADRVILAAGAIGSTELLQRSQTQSRTLKLSPRLGTRISGNGDLIAASHGEQQRVNAIADPDIAPDQRRIGPTITGILKSEDSHGRPLLIEEMAVPATLKRVFDEALSTAVLLKRMGDGDASRHGHEHPAHDSFAVDQGAMQHTQLFAAMGDDGASGTLQYTADPQDRHLGGHSRIVWPTLRDHPLFEHQAALLSQRIRASGNGGTAVANPFWKPVPDRLAPLLGKPRGPLLTVHPLGGCPMADQAENGVVDEYGRLYEWRDQRWETANDFAVLDGAIIPGALCANPALTISALSLRACSQLRLQWNLQPPVAPLAPISIQRPRVPVSPHRPATPTEIEISERLTGPMKLRMADGTLEEGIAELTLSYQPARVASLSRTDANGRLQKPVLSVTSQSFMGLPASRLRLFLKADWAAAGQQDLSDFDRDQWLEDKAVLSAPVVGGELMVFQRQPSHAISRAMRALCARLLHNGGLRDLLRQSPPRPATVPKQKPRRRRRRQMFKQATAALRLASVSGETRLFEYRLAIDPQADGAKCLVHCPQNEIRGFKALRYEAHSNPWRQLMELKLDDCPGMAETNAVLALDPQFLVAHNKPLIHIVRQQDQVQALAELVSFSAYMTRMMLGLHLWNVGLPDPPTRADAADGETPRHGEPARQPPVNRLPGAIKGLLPPQIIELEVGDLPGPDGRPHPFAAHARLTRYRPNSPGSHPPVLFIHGYSASGTTFAHPAVSDNAAQKFTAAGRDVWILDLRSSAGMATATQPWMFEHMALQDIPCAVDEVCRRANAEKIDVVAHCMGAAMLSMALLSADRRADEVRGRRDQPFHDRFFPQRQQLPTRIRKLALSQVGPTVVFTPANLFRAYLLSTAAHYLADRQYAFRPASHGLESLLDRLLATVPYPDDEIRAVNAFAPINRNQDWVGIRRRMDALYGMTFQLANMPEAVLNRLDDFFGPLHLDTVAQVLHFAQVNTITNRDGDNHFVSTERLKKLWTYDTLLLHGENNGLADLATLYRNENHLKHAGLGQGVEVAPLSGLGHQDCWIGTGSARTCDTILAFLDKPETQAPSTGSSASVQYRPSSRRKRVLAIGEGMMAAPPWSGPILGRPSDDTAADQQAVGMGMDRSLGRPDWIVMLRLDQQGRAQPLSAEDVKPWPAGGDSWQWSRWPAASLVAPLSLLPILIYPSDPSLSRRNQRTPRGGLAWFRELQMNKGLGLDLEALPLHEFEDAPWPDGLSEHWVLAELGLRPPVAPSPEELARIQSTVDALREKEPDAPGLCLPRAQDEQTARLRLMLGSCQYPAGLLDREPAWRSYAKLAQSLQSTDDHDVQSAPDLLVLAGDQVYVDATAGLLDPAERDDRYNKPYERWLSEPAVCEVTRQMVIAATLDDHEISDNWEPIHRGKYPQLHRESLAQRHAGLLSHWRLHPDRRYQRARAELAHQPERLPELPANWQSFQWHGFPVFMADARASRWRRDARSLTDKAPCPQPRLLGGVQTTALYTWLLQNTDRPRIIVCGSLLLPRHRQYARQAGKPYGGRTVRADGWEGYPHSLLGLLDHIGRHQLRHLVFLSGDLHLGCFARIRIRDRAHPEQEPIRVTAIHTAGLYRPFPFANAHSRDLLLQETLEFEWSVNKGAATNSRGTRRWSVEIDAETIEHAGFTDIDIREGDCGWHLDCRYLSAEGDPTREFSEAL